MLTNDEKHTIIAKIQAVTGIKHLDVRALQIFLDNTSNGNECVLKIGDWTFNCEGKSGKITYHKGNFPAEHLPY